MCPEGSGAYGYTRDEYTNTRDEYSYTRDEYTLGKRISACVDAVIDILFECMCPCIYVYTITRAHKRIRAEAAICDFFYV